MTVLVDRSGKRGPQPGATSPKEALPTANQTWTQHGGELPDWVLVLAEACDRTSQNAVAKRLGVSSSVISGCINHNYKGTYDSVEKRVRGALMAEEVGCPVLGPLRKDHCLDHQKRARHFAATSTLRVRMYQACRGGCLHSRLSQKVGVQDVKP